MLPGALRKYTARLVRAFLVGLVSASLFSFFFLSLVLCYLDRYFRLTSLRNGKWILFLCVLSSFTFLTFKASESGRAPTHVTFFPFLHCILFFRLFGALHSLFFSSYSPLCCLPSYFSVALSSVSPQSTGYHPPFFALLFVSLIALIWILPLILFLLHFPPSPLFPSLFSPPSPRIFFTVFPPIGYPPPSFFLFF